MSRIRARLGTFLLLASVCAATACGGGGGSDGTDTGGIEIGLVSRTTTTRKTVTLVNPLGAPTVVAVQGATPRLAFDASSLPGAPVAGGASFTCDLLVTPNASGALSDQIALKYTAGGEEQVVLYRVTGTVEVVLVEGLPGALDFGAPAFGAQVERSFTVRNRCALSPVTYTSASLPTNDAVVSSPAFPFTVDPSSDRLVTIRWRPYASMSPIDAMATLNASVTVGSVGCQVRAAPVAGMATIELGTRLLTNGLSEELSVVVPASAWAFQVEAWREGHPYPDYVGIPPSPDLPPYARELISLASFLAPDGTDHTFGWWTSNGDFAACLPRSPDRADQLATGGGTYRFRLRISDPPAEPVAVRVRALVKGAPGGTPQANGVLDLNVWIDSGTGLTAASAPNDALLQAGLAQADALFRTRGIALGDLDYYAYTGAPVSPSGFSSPEDRAAAIRAVFASMPAHVLERPNLFIEYSNGGSGGRTPGCATARSNHNVISAGYRGNLPYLIAHELLHYLGLWHVGQQPMDVQTGAQPPNIMDPAFGQMGNTISPWQGTIVRAHPFIR